MTVGASFRRRDLLRNLAILPSESNIHLVRQQDFIVDPASPVARAFAPFVPHCAKVRLRTSSSAQDDALRNVTSWSGAESSHPIIRDVRIKYVSVYPDGKVTLWSEGAGDPGAIGSI